jgi:hypothetical protein
LPMVFFEHPQLEAICRWLHFWAWSRKISRYLIIKKPPVWIYNTRCKLHYTGGVPYLTCPNCKLGTAVPIQWCVWQNTLLLYSSHSNILLITRDWITSSAKKNISLYSFYTPLISES